jgi:hypothetical protein
MSIVDIDDEDADYTMHSASPQKSLLQPTVTRKLTGVGPLRLALLSVIFIATAMRIGMLAQDSIMGYLNWAAWEGAGQERPGGDPATRARELDEEKRRMQGINLN